MKPKESAAAYARENTWWMWRSSARDGHRTHFSPILIRILAVNVMALAILVGSLLYLGRYQDRIIATELDSLLLQSRIIASAVAEGAVVIDDQDHNMLSPLLARMMVRRLAETTDIRTRLFDIDDNMLADSRALLAKSKDKSQRDRLPLPREKPTWSERVVSSLFDILDVIHERHEYPMYEEQEVQKGNHYEVVSRATNGEIATQVWRAPEGGLTLAVAVPVQHYKQILGSVMMSRSDANIDKAITTVRLDILKIFGITLFITILLSLYLARAIARPIRFLAMAAERLRLGQMQVMGLAGTAKLLDPNAIPDFTDRKDEIGDLSGALRDLTAALAQRISAIENFAADVAHEIKNPLTSLRSAVETAERITDPKAQLKLMAVIRDDVDRLDRLISDISNASRLDAELSRDEAVPVDIGSTLSVLIDFYHHEIQEKIQSAEVVLTPLQEKLTVIGVEMRLAQVLQNLIDNALSFSPQTGKVTLSAMRQGKQVVLTIEDDGPGIPENKLSAIFDRFYSERPRDEKFGTHSGLGLSISKQIVEAHRGTIRAENKTDAEGKIYGARFIVQLPSATD